MKVYACIAAAVSVLALSTPASAQFARPDQAIKYRQSAMYVMNNHMGRIGAMVSGRVPYDAKVAADNADIVATVSKLPWVGFIPGTDTGGNTKAKSEIWTEQAKFKEQSEKMMDDTAKLAAAAKTGNLDALKTAFNTTSATCKACHDAYQKQ
ncbi:MAG: cytochrome c [Pseudomonadota bacterium]